MKKIFCFLVFTWFLPTAYGQIQWTKCIGGSKTDGAEDIHQTTDGGYIVAGKTNSVDGDIKGGHGQDDALVVKLSPTGGIEWQQCLGGSNYERAYSIQQTSDGGYIVAGNSSSSDGDVAGVHSIAPDFWIVKLSSTGNLLWQKCLGGSNIEEAYAIEQTADGGYIVAGNSNSNDGDVTLNHGNTDAWVVKLSDTGAIEWQKSFGGTYDEYATSIQQTYDGGYIFTGSSYSSDGDITGHHGLTDKPDVWVVKISATGSIEWERSFGGSENDMAYCIRQTFDSGYVITGSANSTDGDVTGHIETLPYRDLWVVKLSPSGAMQWNKCLKYNYDDVGFSIQQTTDSGYIVGGSSTTFGTHEMVYVLLVKLSKVANEEWATILGGGRESCNSVSQTSDGGYIIGGSAGTNTGDVSGNHGGGDGWVVKMGSKPSGVTEVINTATITVQPNPASTELTITSADVITAITITGITGQTLYTHQYNAPHEVSIAIAHLPAGMYMVRINDSIVRKFVKQ